jgi:Flp pilus assembly protein TadG
MRRLLRDRRGGVMVEAALVWPMLFAVLFGTIELGRLTWTKLALNFAVQEAARCAVVRPDLCGTDPLIAAYAQAKAQPLTLPSGAIVVSHPACGTQVAASVPYAPTVGGLIFKNALSLSAQVCRL